MPEINYQAVAMTIEENWSDFVQYCDSEEEAGITLHEIKRKAGMVD